MPFGMLMECIKRPSTPTIGVEIGSTTSALVLTFSISSNRISQGYERRYELSKNHRNWRISGSHLYCWQVFKDEVTGRTGVVSLDIQHRGREENSIHHIEVRLDVLVLP